MIHQPTDRQKWFRDRIGKRIYRNAHGCDCDLCKDILEHGVFINDEQHASYCYDIECDFNRDGIPLRYFDTKAEVDEWVADLKLAQEIKDDPEITDILNEINKI